MLSSFSYLFALGCITILTCVCAFTECGMGRLCCNHTIIPIMSFCFYVTTNTSTTMIVPINLYPSTIGMYCGFIYLLCFGYITIFASVYTLTERGMRRLCSNYTAIPIMNLGFHTTTSTGMLMILIIYTYPRTVGMLCSFRYMVCLCCRATLTSVCTFTKCGMCGLCCYHSVIPIMLFSLCITTGTGTLMVFSINLCPRAVGMLCGFCYSLCLCCRAILTSVCTYTIGSMRRFSSDYTIVPIMKFGFYITTDTGTLMGFSINLCPQAVGMCNLFYYLYFTCTANKTRISFDSSCNMSRLNRYFAVVPCMYSQNNITTIARFLMLYIIVLCPIAVCMLQHSNLFGSCCATNSTYVGFAAKCIVCWLIYYHAIRIYMLLFSINP